MAPAVENKRAFTLNLIFWGEREKIFRKQELFRLNPILKDLIAWQNIEIDTSRFSRLADIGAILTPATADQLQKVLETTDVKERLMLTLELLKKEVEVVKLQFDISKRVQEKISEHNRRLITWQCCLFFFFSITLFFFQPLDNGFLKRELCFCTRRYFLEQQLKSIKKELGMEKDEKSALIQKFKDRIDADPPLRKRASEEVIKVCKPPWSFIFAKDYGE